MNNKTMGKDIANPIQREQFIKDNADACENKGYMKAYTPEELQGHKEKLANVSIEISEIENEIKEIKKEYAARREAFERGTRKHGFQHQGESRICERSLLSFHRPRSQDDGVLQPRWRPCGNAPGNRRRVAANTIYERTIYEHRRRKGWHKRLKYEQRENEHQSCTGNE